MIKIIKKWLIDLIMTETSPHKIALSSAIGVYIAFSPFMGFHTLMAFVFAWALSLNISIVLAVSMFINNPVSMVPVYGSGYVFGVWIVKWFGVDLMGGNPVWLSSFNTWIAESIGRGSISMYAFLCGGNILGIVGGLLAYPIIKYYAQIVQKQEPLYVQDVYSIKSITQHVLFKPALAVRSFEDPVYALQHYKAAKQKRTMLERIPFIIGHKRVQGIQQ